MAHLPTIHTPADLRRLSIAQLQELCAEIRAAICSQVACSGGHLAPNLGVVELSVALHYVFDFSHDRLLFDVGHQCYTHKLLTGRQHLLAKLRQRGGMAGFPAPSESPYDLFAVGHAGTAISTAVGMARGDSLNGEGWSHDHPQGRRVVTVIGDASIVNGVAMEGLNGAGTLGRQFLVVLNDNGMSIAKPQGAIAQYFDRVRLSQTYGDFKKAARQLTETLPGGRLARDLYHRLGESSKSFLSDDAWFEHFGLLTIGPVDGHDLPTLIEFLNEAKHTDRPLVLHVKTVKGKGFGFSEQDACTFHSPSPFTIAEGDLEQEGCRVELKKGGRSFTAAFGDAMVALMERDARVCAATAAMPDGTGISKVLSRFPERAWDTGICESHAMDMMAGLAKTGWKPFFAVYSTFLQRAFDQAFQEVALQGLAVRVCLDRAGLVGGDGAVHHGFCDIALLATLPHAALLAPIDEPSLKAAVEFMASYDAGLSAMRYPRASVDPRLSDKPCPAFELGVARPLVEPAVADVAILAYGTVAFDALDALAHLPEYRVAVYDARFAKPVDEALLRRLITAGTPIITIEDHSVRGGFGACVLEACNALGLDTSRLVRMGLPDAWIGHGERAEQMADAGIDAASIARAVRALVDPPAAQGAACTRPADAADPTIAPR